jgi:hypothetical protein
MAPVGSATGAGLTEPWQRVRQQRSYSHGGAVADSTYGRCGSFPQDEKDHHPFSFGPEPYHFCRVRGGAHRLPRNKLGRVEHRLQHERTPSSRSSVSKSYQSRGRVQTAPSATTRTAGRAGRLIRTTLTGSRDQFGTWLKPSRSAWETPPRPQRLAQRVRRSGSTAQRERLGTIGPMTTAACRP